MNVQVHHEVDVSSIASKSSLLGAGISTIGGVNHSELIALAGLTVAFVGLLVNLVFSWRRDQRDAALHRAQIRAVSPPHDGES